MAEKPEITNTRIETYDLGFDGRSFTVKYILNSVGDDQDILLDEHAILSEDLVNKYETIENKISKGHKIKTEVIREVTSDLSSGENYVEIQHWREIPGGLEKLIDDLPSHVKDLLRTEYSDPNVTPHDFGFPT